MEEFTLHSSGIIVIVITNNVEECRERFLRASSKHNGCWFEVGWEMLSFDFFPIMIHYEDVSCSVNVSFMVEQNWDVMHGKSRRNQYEEFKIV